VADAPVAELDQVLEGGRGAALGVEADRRAARRLRLHQDDSLVGSQGLRGGDLEQEIAVNRAGAQGLERLLLPAAVVGGVDEGDRVAGLLRGALGAA
jgi:hypothetical protein